MNRCAFFLGVGEDSSCLIFYFKLTPCVPVRQGQDWIWGKKNRCAPFLGQRKVLSHFDFWLWSYRHCVTDGLGCQVVKKVGASLEEGREDCFGDVLPWLGGSPRGVHHPDVKIRLISKVNFGVVLRGKFLGRYQTSPFLRQCSLLLLSSSRLWAGGEG